MKIFKTNGDVYRKKYSKRGLCNHELLKDRLLINSKKMLSKQEIINLYDAARIFCMNLNEKHYSAFRIAHIFGENQTWLQRK